MFRCHSSGTCLEVIEVGSRWNGTLPPGGAPSRSNPELESCDVWGSGIDLGRLSSRFLRFRCPLHQRYDSVHRLAIIQKLVEFKGG